MHYMKNKYVFLLLILFLISTLAQAQFKPGDVGYKPAETKLFKSQKVKTQIQTVVDEEYYVSTLQVNYYNTDGQLTKIAYDQDTSMPAAERGPEMKDEFTYDENGNIKLIVMYGYDLVDLEHGFKYDKKGKLIESNFASAEARSYTYTYDDAGNINQRLGKVAVFELDAEGNSTDKMVMVDYEKSEYTWDANKNLITETFYTGGELYYKIIYTYDASNRVSGYKVFYELGEDAPPAFTVTFTYDKNGLPEQMITEEEGFRLTNYFAYTFY